MGFRLVVEGTKPFRLGADNIETVKYKTDTPDDSNARSTDVGSILTVTGKIITATDKDKADATLELGLWSLVSAESADCYRKVTLDVVAAGQTVRQIYIPNAFVVDYTEEFGDTEGVGTYVLVIKQKRDKNEFVALKGGFDFTEPA